MGKNHPMGTWHLRQHCRERSLCLGLDPVLLP